MSDHTEETGASSDPGGPCGFGDDPLVVLEAHGLDLAGLTDEQRQVLRDLSTEELELVLDLKSRLDEAGAEVQAHSEIAGGALF